MPPALFIDIILKQEKYTNEQELWNIRCLLISSLCTLIQKAIIKAISIKKDEKLSYLF